MDIKDLVKFCETHAKGYALQLYYVITEPSSLLERRFAPEYTEGVSLAVFLVLSTIIGASIGSVIPNRPPIADRAIIAIVVIVLWVFLSFVVHATCKLLRGKAPVVKTFSAMTQILAAAYVISNFGTLLFMASRKAYAPVNAFFQNTLVDTPGGMLFAIQFTFLLVYIPLAISKAHKFSGLQRALAALIGAGCAVLFGFPIFAMGGC